MSADNELKIRISLDGAQTASAQIRQVEKAVQDVNRTAATSTQGRDTFDDLSDSVQKLLAKYDPLGAKLRSLQADFNALNRAAAGGKIGPSHDAAVDTAYKALNDQLAKTKALMVTAGVAGAEGFKDVAQAAEKSMFATVGARRELMVLGHEAISGNFSRLPGSFMVLAERMDLTGGALAALINPFTLTAAAAAALGVAFLQGSAEAENFNRVLVMSGNASGTSVHQLQALSEQVANATGATKGLAAEVLRDAASTGKVSSDMLGRVAQAAIQLERVGGQAAAETVKEFAELGGAPVEAVKKLDDKYHFLTASVLEQIQVLHDQGQATDAARLAQTTYADTIAERTANLATHLGLLQRAWRDIQDSAKGAWDQMLNIGREGWNPWANLEAGFAKTMPRIAALTARLNPPVSGEPGSRQAKIDAEIAAAEKQARDNARNRAGKDLLAMREQYKSQQERHDQEVIKARELGTQSGASAAEIQELVKRIDEKYATKTPKARAAARDPLDALLENYRRDANAAEVGLAPATVKEIENLGLLLQRGKVDAAEYNRLLDTVLNKDSVLRSEQAQLDKSKLAQSAMGQSIDNLQAQYDRQNAIYGEKQLTAAERELESALRKVEEAADKERARLAQIAATIQGDDVDALAAFAQALQQVADAEAQQKDKVVALQAEQARLNSLWETGAVRALDKYLDSGRTVAAQTEEAFTRAFSGMEDALMNFLTTGKANFADFAKALIADLAKIELRTLLAAQGGGSSGGLLGTLVGKLAGFGSGTGASVASWLGGPESFDYAGYNAVADLIDVFSARGNVFGRSGRIERFARGGVVSAPTLFRFARGGSFGLGVMGEAGDEAVMPLTRDSSGRLGVRAQGAGGAPSITVNIQGNPPNAAELRRSAAQGAREAWAVLNGARRYG